MDLKTCVAAERTMDLKTCVACGDAGPSSAHTEQKERRKQCERPRCRARRHALRAATREQIIATARLVLRAWSAHAGAATRRRQKLGAACDALAASSLQAALRRWATGVAGVREAELLGVLQSLLLQQQEGAAAPPPASPRAYSPLWSAVGSPTSLLSTPASRPSPLGYEPYDPAARQRPPSPPKPQQPAPHSAPERRRPAGKGGRRGGGGARRQLWSAAVDPDDEPAWLASAAESLQHGGTSPRGTVYYDDGDLGLARRLASARWALENAVLIGGGRQLRGALHAWARVAMVECT